MKTFIIAEAGVNHNGDEKMALKLVEAAAASGADAVKFQTFSADKLARKGAEKAEYQKKTTGEGDQHGMLKALEMSEQLHNRLFTHCAKLGIEPALFEPPGSANRSQFGRTMTDPAHAR